MFYIECRIFSCVIGARRVLWIAKLLLPLILPLVGCVQKVTDEYMKKIDSLYKQKEKVIFQVCYYAVFIWRECVRFSVCLSVP